MRVRPLILSSLGLGCALAAGALLAQIEPGDRGIAPVNSASSYEVTGITVDVAARDADAARTAGWREAQRKGWKALYGRLHGVPASAAPGLPDSTLDSLVGGIVIENEQIGPQRYIARLGVLFDRARAGSFLGVRGGQAVRSAPMLVIPVLWSGGALTALELRNPWQAAWARFRTGSSAIDYVRPRGTGADPLLLNAAQTRRPGRRWWRMLVEQYGAADVVVPEASLHRLYPGGPVIGTFTARHGPDGELLGQVQLRAADAAGLPAMLDEGVRRLDEIYTQALRQGGLSPDPTLVEAEVAPDPAEEAPAEGEGEIAEGAAAVAQVLTIQVDTPDVAAVGGAESALRGVPGVRSATVQSLAVGGVSIMRVVFDGDSDALRLALAARGWAAEGGAGSLRVRRAGAAPAGAPPPTP
ncbi:hypothetical protein [Sphingomonas jatrophae]|uniref:Heavy-metal-associated domain-containing protein n=1 Tax=Sphingomonas jatrophae TaxID=1166337 RepID=A0A1I6L583_9SPHN|nr:hypothetical protein [Sphingomonas jatrophae]SFR98567.1 hypothetical protein SAMN05192580_2304 [Sphingomonas jatrophae]